MTEQTWNPTTPNQQVRLRRNPGKRGVTTGQTKESAGRLLVLVNFGPNELYPNVLLIHTLQYKVIL
ncbi:hypothetical protein [Nostoc sp.]|uniref:hypothetical protein n=1 Tax=Nostoc sp. TaxID=1180 RepID=UPI002FFAAF81